MSFLSLHGTAQTGKIVRLSEGARKGCLASLIRSRDHKYALLALHAKVIAHNRPVFGKKFVGQCQVKPFQIADFFWYEHVGLGQEPARGMRKGMIVDVAEATIAIAQAVANAEQTSGYDLSRAFVSMAGEHISSTNSRGAVAISRNGEGVTHEDIERALDAAQAVAIGHVSYCAEIDGGLRPDVMFCYDLELPEDFVISDGLARAVHFM